MSDPRELLTDIISMANDLRAELGNIPEEMVDDLEVDLMHISDKLDDWMLVVEGP